VAGGYTTTPLYMPGLDGTSQMAIGANHACAYEPPSYTAPYLEHLWCFGDNSKGQLGDGTTQSSATPVEITSITNEPRLPTDQPVSIRAISAGGDHTCAIQNG